MGGKHDYGHLTRAQIAKEIADAQKRAAEEAEEIAEATRKSLARLEELRNRQGK